MATRGAGMHWRTSRHRGAGWSVVLLMLSVSLVGGASTAKGQAVLPELPALSQEGFSDPCGVATDDGGDLYVSSYNTKAIKVYSAAGSFIKEFSTAGIGGEGPCGIAVDSAGNVYVTRWGTDIFKYKPSAYPPTGTTTWAPDTAGTTSETGFIASGNSAAVDPKTDNVYIAQGSHISAYQSNGTPISETIGSGVAGANYYGVDVYGKSGNVYATDVAHSKALIFDPTGATVLKEISGAGTPTGAFSFNAFGNVAYLAVDQANGNVYVGDIPAHAAVVAFDEAGNYLTTITHSPVFSTAEPSDIAIDGSKTSPSKGTVYISSLDNHVYAFGPLPPIHPELPALSQEGFSDPCGVATDDGGDLYVSSYNTKAIKVYSAAGSFIKEFSTAGIGGEGPCGIAVDSAGNVYVTRWGTDIFKYKPSAYPPTGTTTWAPDTAGTTSETGFIASGNSAAVDPKTDNVYIAQGSHISAYQSNGTPISETIGSGVAGANYYGVDVYGKSGNVYATDVAHSKALIFDPTGATVLKEISGAGTPTGAFSFNAFGNVAYLAVDQANGNVYVGDIPAHAAVVAFDEAGNYLTTITHSPVFSTAEPSDIAIDGSKTSPSKGTVYISSLDNHVYAFGPLPPSGFEMTVAKAGPGLGTVTSEPGGINCGPGCKASFAESETVTLTATPDPPSAFDRWSGCDVAAGNKCEVTLEEAREVIAYFSDPPAVAEEKATHLTSTSARLEGEVNPNGEAASYQFEYLSLARYEANGNSFIGPNAPAKAPASPASIGTGNAPVAAVEQVGGLAPATAYRFRLIASNPTGTRKGEARAFATYTLPNSFVGTCPANEALRTGPSATLPDCRAYEQASPIDKNGGTLQGKVASVKAASKGAAISFESAAGIPGGKGSQDFPAYLASRSAGSWSTQGLLPSATEGQGGSVLGWTPDFSYVFNRATKYGTGSELLERSTADTGQAKVSPYTEPSPGYTMAASTDDGARVFFEANAQPPLTSGGPVPSAPERRNLYTWERSTGKRLLAGVLPDGSAPLGGSVAGGTGAGSYLQDSHALSGAGDSVYFTAPEPAKITGRLYLRINPIAEETAEKDISGNCEPDASLACTLAVSASEKTNGTGLEGHDAAGSRPAAFMVASTDGSVAYLTSSEKLTDDANTGPEPQPAAIARADIANGANGNLSFLPADAVGVTVHGEYIYWTDPGEGEAELEGTIGRAKLGVSGPEAVDDEYLAGLFNPRDIAVDSEHLYWTEARAGGDGEGTIGRAKVGAAEAEEVDQDCITGAHRPHGIDVDDAFIYWVNIGSESIGRADITSGCGNANSSKNLTFVENSARGDVVVNNTYLYYSRLGSCDINGNCNGFIRRRLLDGTGADFNDCPTIVDAGKSTDPGPSIALDASHIYWVNTKANAIGRAELQDCTNDDSAFIAGAAGPRGLALDSGHIYWSANQEVQPNPGNDLYRFEADGSAGQRLTDIAVDTVRESGIEAQGVLGGSADGSYLYYTANGIPTAGVANSPNSNGEKAEPGNCQGPLGLNAGTCNLYLWHEGQTTFIARLEASGGPAGDFSNWVPRPAVNGAFGNTYQKTARVTPDGRTLLFRSQRQLSAYDNQGVPEFYRYVAGASGPACLTCSPAGAPPTNLPRLGSITEPRVAAGNPAYVLSRNLSIDGRRFFFETTDALVGADTNGEDGCPIVGADIQNYPACLDVYEWEAKGSGSCKSDAQNGGCLYLLSTGEDDEPALFGDANESGDDAFIFTTDQLVPQDGDDLLDAYDVRVGGGIASQHTKEAPPCLGEAGCRAPGPQVPTASQSGSLSFSGADDPKPSRHHHAKKHHRKKHTKHRRRGKSHKHRRAAKTSGRAR